MIDLGTEIRWQDRLFEVPMERILLSELWGYDAVFTAEGWGSECFMPLGYVAATRSISSWGLAFCGSPAAQPLPRR